jgi:N-acetylmuramic acid 6-phosphate etherase
MVRLGKAYGNLMVDLRQGSAKLRDRARRIVAAAGKVTTEDATSLLAEAGGEAKTAIVMARLSVGAEEARHRIAEAGGHVRAAVDARAGVSRRAPRRRPRARAS